MTEQDRTVRLEIGAQEGTHYANAQADDYHQGGARFRWRPPLRLQVEARFSHGAEELRGTAGFGFWNDPFGMAGRARWDLPRTLWFFFAGPPSDLPLAAGVAGRGWKAATLDARRWGALATLPAAPLIAPMLRIHRLYHWWWRRVQRRLRIGEALIPVDLRAWHHYEIEWGVAQCRFWVDDRLLLSLPFAPGGPMGLVTWIDNQFMVMTPQGRFRHGVVAAEAQWLEIRALRII
ncbi:MAG: hypothetical protein IT329_06475 [Caldilineaceae bacterium]|nr:hypothetical protein [Caldilineaceae bacterium]